MMASSSTYHFEVACSINFPPDSHRFSDGEIAGSTLAEIRDVQSIGVFGRPEAGGLQLWENHLLNEAKAGNEHAFVELCGKCAFMVKSKISKIARNQEEAEDALQDTLMRAYSHLKSFRRSCKLSTWLTTIGANSALMILRKRRARGETWTSARKSDVGAMEPHEPVDR